MIQAGQCKSYNTSPDIQLIQGYPVPAKPKKESVVGIIVGAATAVMKAIQQGSPASGDTSTSAGKSQLCTYHAHMYTRAHTSVHRQAHTHTHICACTHTRAHAHTCTHTHTHTHTHTYTHTHTHKWCMEIVTHDTSLSGIT